ncbi:hypothetical protein RN001_014821 [Aquatica leii]|uniref:Uncharacterized protein n=1 Tax=Aquatica leii TaxID=1421715 RepID=A0AAN7SBQ4_9COLE|nr:hypothetical protein RN001_014821 [Aquatica leii]
MILTLPNDTHGVVLKAKTKLEGQWAFNAIVEDLEREKSDDYVENSDVLHRIKRESNNKEHNNNDHQTTKSTPNSRSEKQISTTTPVSTTAKPKEEGFLQKLGRHLKKAFNTLLEWALKLFQ